MMTALQTAFAQKMRVNLANGETFVYKVSQVESVIFDDGTASPEYVDLGLPSGTLWATFNVGATCPEDYGDYLPGARHDQRVPIRKAITQSLLAMQKNCRQGMMLLPLTGAASGGCRVILRLWS